ncbi:MAG: 50S ribosomal protein L17 [Cyclobacteriaceae bacterium]|nr:50S ribosomal protein L17 [Cyclobacteriaceae bacterium]
MRHGKRFNHLGRTASHRKAMLSNMASSLILHKRISTTVAKAKALRQYVEPLITKSKTDSTHSRRIVFSYLQDKESVKVLFDEISEKVNDRPGGYTRIIKTGSRLGDNADMCIMELVDYNELLLAEKEPKKAKTRRSRRGKKSTQTEALPEVTAEPVSETEDVEETDMVSEPAEEQVDDVKAEIVEETVEEVKETETITAEASEEESKESSEPDADSEEDSKKE